MSTGQVQDSVSFSLGAAKQYWSSQGELLDKRRNRRNLFYRGAGSGRGLHHYESENKDMPKVRFHPVIEWFAGKAGNMVFRRSHNGKVSVYETPSMEGVKWSQAQKDQRQRMGEASRYASAAIADPDIRPIYVQMAVDHNKNPGRPFDMAVSDYYHHGNDLLWKKHMGDQEKPKNWDIERYSWYLTNRKPRYFNKRKRRW